MHVLVGAVRCCAVLMEGFEMRLAVRGTGGSKREGGRGPSSRGGEERRLQFRTAMQCGKESPPMWLYVQCMYVCMYVCMCIRDTP